MLHRIVAPLAVAATLCVGRLAASLPTGYRLHKGMTLDLHTMRGSWPVAGSEDPNCCPSRLLFEVALVGTTLRLVRSRLLPP